MKTFTVKRSKWARGGKNGEANLFNDDGCMCCLGFALCQISHVAKARLKDQLMPWGIMKRSSFLTIAENGMVRSNELAKDAATINDDKSISEKVRENRLTKLFKKHKIAIKFVD